MIRRHVVFVGFVGVLLVCGLVQAQIPQVETDSTVILDEHGRATIKMVTTYPGNLYNLLKQFHATNPYGMFKGIIGENQPNFILDKIQIDFDDARRKMKLTFVIPDFFRYGTDGWKTRHGDWFKACRVVSQDKNKAILTCSYPLQNAMTAYQLVNVSEKVTLTLPEGGTWTVLHPKRGQLTYTVPLPFEVRNLKGPALGFMVLGIFSFLIGIVGWFIRVPETKHVKAEPRIGGAVRKEIPAPYQAPEQRVRAKAQVGVEPTQVYVAHAEQVSSLTLTCIEGNLKGQQFIVSSQAIIGRDPNHATILIQEPHVSRRQVRIFQDASGQWFVENLSSTNPTSVNGSVIQRATPLRPGDILEFSGYRFQIG